MAYSAFEINRAIRKGLPISECGLLFYPITMAHYEEFLACKDALCVRQASLPARYLSLDYFSAIFSLEMASVQSGEAQSGLLLRLAKLIYLALQLDFEAEAFLKGLTYTANANGTYTVESLLIVSGENETRLTAGDFAARVRPLIAQQNALILPQENFDNGLVEAEEERQKLLNKTKLKPDVETLLASVAYQSGCRVKDLDEWTVKEFEERRRAIDRDKSYTINAQAEMSGMVTFKNGNPVPSWCYDAERDDVTVFKTSDVGLQHLENKSQI